jgi:hypothetical protein
MVMAIINNFYMTRTLTCIIKLVVVIICIALLSCTPSLKQYYPDTYYLEDSIYENKSLHFLITYSSVWYLFTEPEEFDQKTRQFYRQLHKSHMELLFAGATTDGLYGTRCISANYNLRIRTFAENIRQANRSDIENDQGLTEFYAGRNPAIKWVYDQNGFRFVEFFFKIDTHDIRISFWTKSKLFENYLSVFEQIISTFTVTGPSL